VIDASTAGELRFACFELQHYPTSELRGITYRVDGEPKLIVLFDNWTDNSVSMHQWCEHPKYFTRAMLRECFKFAFDHKGIAIGTVRSDNPKALEVDRKIGFTPVAVIPDVYGPGIDMHILQLRRDDCRWYKP